MHATRNPGRTLISFVVALYEGVEGRVPSLLAAGIRGSASVGSTVVYSGPAAFRDLLMPATVPAIGAAPHSSAPVPAFLVPPNGPRAIAAIVRPTVRSVTTTMLMRSL